MDKALENKIKVFMAEKLASGESLSELQDEVNAEFNLKLTYMDIRILASALPVNWKSRDPEKPAAKEENTPDDSPAEAAPEAEQGTSTGKTVVEVNKIVRPGMAVSGSVKFANGSTAEWYVDQTGRLGLDNLKGDNPGREDIEAFQIELQKIFQR